MTATLTYVTDALSSTWLPAVFTLLAVFVGAYALAALDGAFALGPRQWRLALVAPLSEALRLLRQQPTRPAKGDTLLFRTAPLIALTVAGLTALVLPLGPGLSAFDPSIGLFYFVVLFSPFIIAVMNAGWSQNANVGLFAAFRAAAHLISYEVPLGFAMIGAPMAAQSLAVGRIVAAQAQLWFAVWQPLGLVIYVISLYFVCFRHPFDGALAGSELEGGALSEYDGARLLLFKVALNAIFLILVAMGVELFFGGWQGPWLPGPVWLVGKTLLLAALLTALSRFVPRLRHDQMLTLCWKALVPASLVNILLVGVLIELLYGVSGG